MRPGSIDSTRAGVARRPRVLHVGKFYPPVEGGMERVLASLCRATSARIDSRVLVYSQGGGTSREVVDGVPVTRLATVSVARSTPVATGLARELRRADADLVVLHEPNPWALLSCALTHLRQPLAIWYHSEVVRPRLQYGLFYHPMVRTVFRRAQRIVVSSPSLGRQARALRPYQDKISVIPFGIDASDWAGSAAHADSASRITAAAGARPIVLFTGRMVAYKGVDVLLRALTELDAYAVLIGDGPLRGSWQQLARDLGLADRTHFPGQVAPAELRALYRAADVFVLPSISQAEAFGYVQLEAMASGVPVVSTRVGSGVEWVNQHGVTGLTVSPGDAAELAHALRLLLADPVLRRRMGDAGLHRVRTEFSSDLMGHRVADLFQDLATGGRFS